MSGRAPTPDRPAGAGAETPRRFGRVERPVRFALAALAVLAVAEVGARLALGSSSPALRWHDYGAEAKVAQMEARAGDRHDLVVIGTSMAQQDLVPEVLADGLGVDRDRVYNAALDGGVPVLMSAWTMEEVLPRVPADRVVWGISALDLSSVYGGAPVDAWEEALETRDGWLAGLDRVVADRSALVANRSVLRTPRSLRGDVAVERAEARTEAAIALGPAGERIDFDPALSPAREAEIRGRITPFQLDRDDLAALARTIDRLRADGVEVVLVELPLPPRFTELYPRGPGQQVMVSATIEALGRETGVPAITLDSLDLDLDPGDGDLEDGHVGDGGFEDADFVDYTHLDREAAARFSAAVAARLAELD